MTPKITLHLVRHAQGYHNLSMANHTIPDPLLTLLGETQCHTLSTTFPTSSSFTSPPKITHLVASPLRRTLYTCLLSFPLEVERGLIITALPELQETSDLPCDTGSSREVLENEFNTPGHKQKVDFELVKDGWNYKIGKWSPASKAIEARAREARIWLRELGLKALKEAKEKGVEEDVNIVAVTHGGLLHYFTEDWVGHNDFEGTGWANTEYRSYEFVDLEEAGGSASLVETKGSRLRRKENEIPLTRDEQRELRASAERQSAEEGYISML